MLIGNGEDNRMDAITRLIAKITPGRRFVLGIDGLSRSGKTTFVSELSQKIHEKDLPCHIFHLDDHIVERNRRYETGNEEWYEYYQLQWNVDWPSENLFDKLQGDEGLKLPFYDEYTDKVAIEEVNLPKEGLILIEGVFLQRQEWRKFFDYVIYLDCPREVRFKRESSGTQMKKEKFRIRYWPAGDHYLDLVNPQNIADIVIGHNINCRF